MPRASPVEGLFLFLLLRLDHLLHVFDSSVGIEGIDGVAGGGEVKKAAHVCLLVELRIIDAELLCHYV